MSSEINRSIRSIHLLADLLIALRGYEHLDAGLVDIVDVGPVSLDLGVFYATGQAVNGPRRPEENIQPPIAAKNKSNARLKCYVSEKFKERLVVLWFHFY